MIARRPLVLVCLVATMHGLFFIWYQRPDWNTQFDQEGYRRLGEVLATTGKFTRFPDAPAFVPEVIRTPAYPIFVALVYRVFGVHQIVVALAQTALFAVICVLVLAIGRRVASERTAQVAAIATVLFPPIPYFAALVMTEVWTTLLFTASMYVAVTLVTAAETSRLRRFVLLGVLLGVTTLSRPVFVLFPFALAAVGVIVLPLASVPTRSRAVHWPLMLAAFAVTMLPWFTYNYATLGRFTLSPAGGIGRGLWEGSWQAVWSGRLQNELTHLADDVRDREALDARVRDVAAREHRSPASMLEYVHQWQDIRRIWATPTDPYERAVARVKADQEYQRVALENLRQQPMPHLLRRLARGVFVLWAGEIPFRYSEINTLPPMLIYLCWAVQAILVCGAIAGLVVLARIGRVAAAAVLATPIVYITAVHFPLLTEARQSLPAQPIVLLLATIAAIHAVGHSLPREPQVHEREHL